MEHEKPDLRTNKILVTGSSGTIGTRLCEELIKKGKEVVGVDWRSNRWNETVNALTINIDLRDKEAVLEKLPKEVCVVVHLAANARVYNLVKTPLLARDNFETLFNILEYTRKNNVRRFIFASSREVYGNSDRVVHQEDESYVKNCESPYTASKIGGEALVHSYRQCYGIDFLIFRFSNVYGMYDDGDRVVPLFIKLCKEGRDLVIFGKNKLLDFTYIDDAVEGIIRGIERFETAKNNVFNLSHGEGVLIFDLAQLLRKNLKAKNEIKIEENRLGEVVKYVADISKAKEKLGYYPKTDIVRGIERSIKWYGSLSA